MHPTGREGGDFVLRERLHSGAPKLEASLSQPGRPLSTPDLRDRKPPEGDDMTEREVERIARRVAELVRIRDEDELYSVEQVASRLELSARTVRTMLQRGVIPSYKIEGARRVMKRDIDAYLAAHREEGIAS
jgi:excisionase family DNA binding protein